MMRGAFALLLVAACGSTPYGALDLRDDPHPGAARPVDTRLTGTIAVDPATELEAARAFIAGLGDSIDAWSDGSWQEMSAGDWVRLVRVSHASHVFLDARGLPGEDRSPSMEHLLDAAARAIDAGFVVFLTFDDASVETAAQTAAARSLDPQRIAFGAARSPDGETPATRVAALATLRRFLPGYVLTVPLDPERPVLVPDLRVVYEAPWRPAGIDRPTLLVEPAP